MIVMASEFDIFAALLRHEVPFVVIGGHAVNFHGYGRLTEDTDLVWLRSPPTEQSLMLALTELEAQYIGSEIDPHTRLERTYPVTLPFIRSNPLMMLLTRHGFLDLFDYIPGLPEERVKDLFESSVEVEQIHYASLGWLRRMKTAAGRSKDALDLENLPE